VATGAFLLVQVLTLSGTVRAQAAAIGGGTELMRATVLIAVVVLLVGVVEVAVCTTRTVVHRTREMGVLSATGVPRAPVVAALLVEPVLTSFAGALAGGVVSAVLSLAGSATGVVEGEVPPAGALLAVLAAVVTSGLAAVLTSTLPVYRAASRPPVHSLTSIGPAPLRDVNRRPRRGRDRRA
jgi:ABC-type antimicrobial peptide transport system permease subunit